MPARLRLPMMSAIWRMMRGASPSLGSSSSISRGFATSARAIASICCSPPDNCSAAIVAAGSETGEIVEYALDRPAAVGDRARRDREILLDRERGKDRARLLHEGNAGARDLEGRKPADVAALEGHPAAPGATMRMIERSVVVLPAPLRPSSATTLPAGTRATRPG